MHSYNCRWNTLGVGAGGGGGVGLSTKKEKRTRISLKHRKVKIQISDSLCSKRHGHSPHLFQQIMIPIGTYDNRMIVKYSKLRTYIYIYIYILLGKTKEGNGPIIS
jgi:hypothetical protein